MDVWNASEEFLLKGAIQIYDYNYYLWQTGRQTMADREADCMPLTRRLTVQLILLSTFSSLITSRYSRSNCIRCLIVSTKAQPISRIVEWCSHFSFMLQLKLTV